MKNVKREANKLICIILAIVFVCLFLVGAGSGLGITFTLATCFTGLAFLVLKEYLSNRLDEYGKILNAIQCLTREDFKDVVKENLGVFEPMKEELQNLHGEVRNAIETEVKSERMKAELITNVSHDLKTPLTAITTYVELLKKDDITDEERVAYIDTLEKKSTQMKVLIEDLFDLSKANSKDVVLNITSVDIINLMKQVVVEHHDKYEEMGLQLIWNTCEERIEVPLDNQKIYRVFENLFLNIEKYAMKNSRVYIDVAAGDEIEVVIRNMSAEALHISGEQLTERFVRGDESRNTEGSGLGLAIAKSFIELQGGVFEVTVDGDLFKTGIRLKK